MAGVLTLDGSRGEGGGQIVRTALALAVALGRRVAIERIRLRRPRPGLQPQHLTVVRALAAISDAAVEGDALDSTAVSFAPRTTRAGEYRFDVGAVKGSAGSVSLLLQALLLPLAGADRPSRLTLVGGTHVPWSPSVHYLTTVFLPALRALGVAADLTLRRWGWYPAGGGEVEATIEPIRRVDALVVAAPATPVVLTGCSAVSRLPRSIAERQRCRAETRLAAAGLKADIAIEEDRTAIGAGTMIFLGVPGRAGFSALGRRGLLAERVADAAVDALLEWRESAAALDVHLADQLLPFLVLADGVSSFTCPEVSLHLRTVAWVVQRFVPAQIALLDGRPARVEIHPAERRPSARSVE
ncbi:MAG TPA: RNA 3'-terminal phosphate cyclase [Methylomirabilota bacterium]|nr:RNA 3'-terminal phosphate cyclase [Methylomirabilota bacterium]